MGESFYISADSNKKIDFPKIKLYSILSFVKWRRR
jgi:hypothetical protein